MICWTWWSTKAEVRLAAYVKWLVDLIWQTAKQAAATAHFTAGYEVVSDDDHAPFLRAGFRLRRIIQLALSFWHTRKITLDKISPKG